jgi:hypothetical protein
MNKRRRIEMSKPEEGQVVEINADPTGIAFVPIKAKVAAVLSVQFTAHYMDGTDTLTYQFYNDEGGTWRHTDG